MSVVLTDAKPLGSLVHTLFIFFSIMPMSQHMQRQYFMLWRTNPPIPRQKNKNRILRNTSYFSVLQIWASYEVWSSLFLFLSTHSIRVCPPWQDLAWPDDSTLPFCIAGILFWLPPDGTELHCCNKIHLWNSDCFYSRWYGYLSLLLSWGVLLRLYADKNRFHTTESPSIQITLGDFTVSIIYLNIIVQVSN